MACRAWIENGDSLEEVYYDYDVLEHMVQAMDNLQTFVNFKTEDSVQVYQAKLKLKMKEWFGHLKFPLDPVKERRRYVCVSEIDKQTKEKE